MSSSDRVYPGNFIPPERELPAATGASPVRNVAEGVGNAVGSAVSGVRHLPERLQQVKNRLVVIQGRAREDAREKAREVKDKAGEAVAEARARVNRLSREYPLALVAAAAACGFLIGMALRIGRDHD